MAFTLSYIINSMTKIMFYSLFMIKKKETTIKDLVLYHVHCICTEYGPR